MRVFVTGASGFIGTAVVRELCERGHDVVGLARSDASAAVVEAAGGSAVRGDIDDLDAIGAAASAADGVVHLAFSNDFSDYAGAVAQDLRAVEALGRVLSGADKPFVVTSGTLVLAFAGGVGTEDVALDSTLPRMGSENATIALASSGVRSSVVRLAPCVHDETRAGLATRLIDIARETGVSGYVGDGANRWPGVHRLDAAHLFCLALEAAPAGARLHATDEEGVPFVDIATAIGRHLDVPVQSVELDHFGDLAMAVGLDNPTSSDATRALLGWQPAQPGLLADLARIVSP
jgi:nucleoside-diphosphate-sugar epimerase